MGGLPMRACYLVIVFSALTAGGRVSEQQGARPPDYVTPLAWNPEDSFHCTDGRWFLTEGQRHFGGQRHPPLSFH